MSEILKTLALTVESGNNPAPVVVTAACTDGIRELPNAVSATLTADKEWVSFTPSAGTTPFESTMNFNTSVLPPGIYAAKVQGTPSPTQLPTVTLTVTAPVPPPPPPPPADTTLPVVTISAPLNGARITSKKVTVKASATDDKNVVRLDVYINGVWKAGAAGSSIQWVWNTASYKKQTITIEVHAIDGAGNIGVSKIQVVKA